MRPLFQYILRRDDLKKLINTQVAVIDMCTKSKCFFMKFDKYACTHFRAINFDKLLEELFEENVFFFLILILHSFSFTQ
jgi:hypothetical protein